MKTCLFNTQSNNIAGYCRHHHCYMTVKQIKCKSCLAKGCWHLEKNENHDWWRQREAVKQKKKERKEQFAQLVQ